MTHRVNVFAGAHFDRLGHRRTDTLWLKQCFEEKRVMWVPVWQNKNLVLTEPDPCAALLSTDAIAGSLRDDCILLGEIADQVCFAVDLGESATDRPTVPVGDFQGLRSIGLSFPEDQSALLAYAQAMVLWHRRHRYCGLCGTATTVRDAGHARRCSDPVCNQVVFPRIDPAIIVLIEHKGRALLGRQSSWPVGVYSTIAGFVEPGESLEDAVRREAYEETGIGVGAVHYHSSQPWPFPSSLMLGFYAEAKDTEIRLIDNELEDARWFSRDDLATQLRSGVLNTPPQLSISSRLIAHWYDQDTPGLLAKLIADITK